MFKIIHASDQKRSEVNYSSSIKTIDDLKNHVLFDIETGCWEWIHGKDSYGYGRATFEGRPIDVHRLSWILQSGREQLVEGILVCHSCDNPACCNPEHLFLGTILTNNRDSNKKGRRAHQKMTHCKNGHLRTEENMYKMKRKDGRERIECKQCSSDRAARQYAKKTRGWIDE